MIGIPVVDHFVKQKNMNIYHYFKQIKTRKRFSRSETKIGIFLQEQGTENRNNGNRKKE